MSKLWEPFPFNKVQISPRLTSDILRVQEEGAQVSMSGCR